MKGSMRALSLAAAMLLGLMVFAVATPASHQARAQGEQTTVTKTVAPFTSIQIEGGGQATLTFGPEPSVTIEGNSLIVDQLEVEVSDGELTVGSPLTSALDVTGLSELTYAIVTPAISEIHLAGTVTLDVVSIPSQAALEIGLTTGAQLNVGAMDVGVLTGKLDLLSTAELSGSAGSMQLEINNGSNLEAGQLQVGAAELVLNGLSKATVRVTESLTGRASQGSTVSYISQTVEPNMTLTTMATTNELPYTEWNPPAPVASPAAGLTAGRS